jgi:hypothetical protein
MLSTTLVKSSDGPARAFTGIKAGTTINGSIHDVQMLDTSLQNGATENFVWAGHGTKDISIGWLPQIQVRNSDGTGSAGAVVQILDNSGQVVYEGITDSQGNLANVPVVTTVFEQTGTDPNTISTVDTSGILVQATNGSRRRSGTFTVSGDGTLTLILP